MDALKNTDTITVQQDVHFVCQKKFFSGMFKYNINMRYYYVYIYIHTEYAAANIDDPPDYLHLFTMRHLRYLSTCMVSATIGVCRRHPVELHTMGILQSRL